jgi:hypothetical protein
MNRFRDGVATVLLAVLTVYGHILFALGLAVPALYAIWRTPRRWSLMAMFAAATVLMIPLAVQTRAFLAMDTVHMFAEIPVLDDLWAALAPPQLFATLGLGLLSAYVTLSVIQSQWRPTKSVATMLVAWLVLAPAFLFLLGRTTTIQLFLPRYLLSTAPAAALLVACVIRSLHPMSARRIVIGVIMGLSSIAFVASSKFSHGEDWRNAMAAVRTKAEATGIPVLMASCFVEAQAPKDLVDPRLQDVLFAPQLFYPSAGRVIHLPYRFSEAYLNQVAERELAGETHFLLLTCGDNDTAIWLSRQAMNRRFRVELLGNFRGLELREFQLVLPERSRSGS